MSHPTTPDAHRIPQSQPTGDRRADLEQIRAAKWPPGEMGDRVAAAQAALDALPPWDYPVALDAATWKYIAESADALDSDA